MFHRAFYRSFTFTVALIMGSAPEALPQPPRGAVHVHTLLAPAAQPMSDLDHYVGNKLGGTWLYGVETGVMVTPTLSLGLSWERNASSSYQEFFTGDIFLGTVGFANHSLETSITDVTANATLWVPRGRGFFVGAEAGAGIGQLTEALSYSDRSAQQFRYHGDWDRTGLVGGAYAGFRHAASSGLLVLVKAGYKFRDMGRMDGQRVITASTFASDPPGVDPGPIKDSSGQELRSNFSCLYFGLGLGFFLGRRR
jgi:hypothetical protein